MLLVGQFNYGKAGILDRTHTRLFTFRSLRYLLRDAGFRIKRVRGIPAPFPLARSRGGARREVGGPRDPSRPRGGLFFPACSLRLTLLTLPRDSGRSVRSGKICRLHSPRGRRSTGLRIAGERQESMDGIQSGIDGPAAA